MTRDTFWLIRPMKSIILVFAVLCGQVVFGADGGEAVTQEAHLPYDPTQWTVVKTVTANFGRNLTDAKVLLLKSVDAKDEDGMGDPMYGVRVLITHGDRLLFEPTPVTRMPVGDSQMAIFYWNDPLELKDVTDDGIPEVIYYSGMRGVSDWVTAIHVLRYAGDDNPGFDDIRTENFVEGLWGRFQWVAFEGHTLGISAEAKPPPIDTTLPPEVAEQKAIDEGCHQCPKLYDYLVYRWDPKQAKFVLRTTIPSTGQLHNVDEQDPFKRDWAYILKQLKERQP